MPDSANTALICRKYRQVFGATLTPAFGTYLSSGARTDAGAMLGYRRAGAMPLFLERYLDKPVEAEVSDALGRQVSRERIVEIGNFAADNALAMIALWGAAANDLGSASEVAVATLTAPLRRMFARIGVPITVLAPARPELLGGDTGAWGSYYEFDPRVCIGEIAKGQGALTAFLQRHRRRQAA